MAETLDKTDLQILRVLQENARITIKELAFKVHLSTTPVFDRMRRLEQEGGSLAVRSEDGVVLVIRIPEEYSGT